MGMGGTGGGNRRLGRKGIGEGTGRGGGGNKQSELAISKQP